VECGGYGAGEHGQKTPGNGASGRIVPPEGRAERLIMKSCVVCGLRRRETLKPRPPPTPSGPTPATDSVGERAFFMAAEVSNGGEKIEVGFSAGVAFRRPPRHHTWVLGARQRIARFVGAPPPPGGPTCLVRMFGVAAAEPSN